LATRPDSVTIFIVPVTFNTGGGDDQIAVEAIGHATTLNLAAARDWVIIALHRRCRTAGQQRARRWRYLTVDRSRRQLR
jgi:hypothetical protein